MADKGFIIVEGATAYCSSSVANNAKGTAVPMEVKSQKKKLGKNKYFAQSKPVATYLDDKAESFGGGNGFGNCKGSDGKPYPCKAKCSLKYKDYYENVEFNKSMKVLLDVSTATCPGYGVPGTVAFATTGQANNVSQIDVKEADEFSVANTSPQWETSGTSSATTSVNSIAMTLPIPVARPAGTYYYVKLPSNPLTSFFNPLSTDNLTLTAQFKGDATKIIWAIFKGEDTKDKVKTFIGLGSVFNQSLSKIFDNLSEGKYRIEAYGKKAGDKNCAIIIEVVKDFVKKIVVPGDSTLVNIPFPVSVEYKLTSQADKMKMLNGNAFMPLTTMAKWRIKQGTTVLHNSDSGIASPHLVAVGSLGGTASLIFKNAGKYTLEAFTDPNDPKPESVEIKIENTLSVMGVSGEPGLLRSGDMLKIQASKFNVAYLPAAGKTVHWYLKREGSGRITAFESSSSFKTALINKKADAFLSQDAQLSSGQYIGKYIMEAYASPLGSTKQPAFTGSDTFHFEIINNVIDKFTLPAGNIPKGTKVKYTGTARIATLAGNEAIKVEVPQNVTDNGDGTLTFNELGEYTISAYLTGSNTDNKKIETKIKVSQPTVKRALWAYGTGVKRTETGFGEETYGFVEIDGLQNQALKVKIWVKGEGDDFYKQKEKFMLEEKSVTLDSQGKASFMINATEDYKKKLAEAIPKTTENPTPSYRLVFTIELQSGTTTDVVLPANISIEGTRPVVIDATTTYLEVLDSNEELVITSEQKIVSIMFSSEDGKGIQREQTFYGKTHKIWVHTVNMTEEILKIDVFKEVPKEGLNERDHIVYTHESKETYKEEKTGKDGLLEVSFTAKEEWKTPPKNFDYYIAQVSRQLKDPADPNKKIWKAEKMQVTLNDSLPASLVRTEDMEKLGIKAYKQDGTPFTQEEMLELRKQFIFYEAGCLKVSQKATPEAIDNEVMPVVVEMAEVKREGGECQRCKAKITLAELQQTFFNGNKSLIEKCLPYINEYFEKFKINTCKLKAHFFAQVRTETDLVTLTESLKYKYETLFSSDLGYYKGNDERCKRDALNDREIGINAYGTKNNNRPNTDDGFVLRGRGFIMVTGRINYKNFQIFFNNNREALNLPKLKFVTLDNDFTDEHPELLAEEKYAVLSGIGFWITRNLSNIVNTGTDELKIINSLIDIINSRTNSRDKRRASYQGGKYTFKSKEYTYEKGTKQIYKVDECGKNNTSTSLNLENSDLKIKEGIEWLLTKAISQDDVANGTDYTVPYVNDESRVSASGENSMDCSELVCRYFAKIEWCSKGWAGNTAVLYDFGEDYKEYLVKHDSLDYKPKIGDIFLWKNLNGGMGHTGVVIDYDEENDVVTTVEAISSKEQPYGLNKSISMKGVTKLQWKRDAKHLISHPLTKKNKSGGTDDLSSCRFYTPLFHHSKVDKIFKWTKSSYEFEIKKK